MTNETKHPGIKRFFNVSLKIKHIHGQRPHEDAGYFKLL